MEAKVIHTINPEGDRALNLNKLHRAGEFIYGCLPRVSGLLNIALIVLDANNQNNIWMLSILG
jgi:hypothetical protein